MFLHICDPTFNNIRRVFVEVERISTDKNNAGTIITINKRGVEETWNFSNHFFNNDSSILTLRDGDSVVHDFIETYRSEQNQKKADELGGQRKTMLGLIKYINVLDKDAVNNLFSDVTKFTAFPSINLFEKNQDSMLQSMEIIATEMLLTKLKSGIGSVRGVHVYHAKYSDTLSLFNKLGDDISWPMNKIEARDKRIEMMDTVYVYDTLDYITDDWIKSHVTKYVPGVGTRHIALVGDGKFDLESTPHQDDRKYYLVSQFRLGSMRVYEDE